MRQRIGIGILVGCLFELSSCATEETRGPELKLGPSSLEERVLLVILDGTNEEIFRSMLEAGDLPHLGALLQPDASGRRHGVYTAATSVWPSTTGPAYVPFVGGLFPNKSGLSGIRQYLRGEQLFRSYCGSDVALISQDLSKEFPTVYEVLGPEETFNQSGFVSRRGWSDEGAAIGPIHQNLTSTPGIFNAFFANMSEADLYNSISFLNYVTPEFDLQRMREITSFKGKMYSWNMAMGTYRLATEELYGLLGLGRVVTELDVEARKLGKLPRFSFLGLHLPDNTSHGLGIGLEYREALQRVDEIIGFMLAVFERQGVAENLTLMISADHGTSAVGPGDDSHFRLIKELSRDTGVPIRDSIKTLTQTFNSEWNGTAGFPGDQRRWAGIGAISGNANVQLYLRKPGSANWTQRPDYEDLRAYENRLGSPTDRRLVDLIDALLVYPQVSRVYAADRGKNEYHIFSRHGEGIIRVRTDSKGTLSYAYANTDGDDPLGYAGEPELRPMVDGATYFEGDAWAAASRATNYPDAIVQIVQLLDAENSGDIIVDAAPMVEPWDENQAGLHGALRREHLVVPLLIYGPRLDAERAEAVFASGRMPRTVDLYPTILALLGEEPPSRISWEVRKWFGLRREERSADVRTDIDGQRLDVWSSPTTAR